MILIGGEKRRGRGRLGGIPEGKKKEERLAVVRTS